MGGPCAYDLKRRQCVNENDSSSDSSNDRGTLIPKAMGYGNTNNDGDGLGNEDNDDRSEEDK